MTHPGAYGDAWADVYDDEHRHLSDIAATVDVLAELAGGGRVLELGVGTGRVAIPLARRGLEVHGLDASARMLEVLAAKDGGEGVTTHRGDMAGARVDGSFAVVVVVFNTLFNLPSQEAQIAAVANAARHLAPDGRFVVEAFVPDLSRFSDDQAVRATSVAGTAARVSIERHDPVAQAVDSVHLRIDPDGTITPLPVSIRYAWPSELDLMAASPG